MLTVTFKNDYLIGTLLGLLSAVVDNVPLVAAAQGMYDLKLIQQIIRFGSFWHYYRYRWQRH